MRRLTDDRISASYTSVRDRGAGRACRADRGPNGAGKTNLLEAISLLSPGSRPAPCKVAPDDDRPQRRRSRWAVAATGRDAPTALIDGRHRPDRESPARRSAAWSRLDGETHGEKPDERWPTIAPVVLADPADGPAVPGWRFGAAAFHGPSDPRVIDPGPCTAVAWPTDTSGPCANVLRLLKDRMPRSDAWLSGGRGADGRDAASPWPRRAASLAAGLHLAGALQAGIGPFPAAAIALDGMLEEMAGSTRSGGRDRGAPSLAALAEGSSCADAQAGGAHWPGRIGQRSFRASYGKGHGLPRYAPPVSRRPC